MIESILCKNHGCEKGIIHHHSELLKEYETEGYCSQDCMETDLRKLYCPVCSILMEFNSETAYFTCSRCGQELRW